MRSQARIVLFTGDGKGKTTAALGMAIRASGHGLRTLIVQFIKSNSSTGEIPALKNLPGVEIVQTGKGFVPARSDPHYPLHQQSARDGLKLVAEAIASRKYHLVILDEVCTAVSKELLDEEKVAEAIGQADGETCLVLTGRGAPKGLLDLADTVTEMCCIKHGFQAGIPAQEGVEF